MWIGPVHPRRSSREKIRRSRLKEDRAKSSARGKKKYNSVTAGDRVRMGNASRAIYARSASPATSPGCRGAVAAAVAVAPSTGGADAASSAGFFRNRRPRPRRWNELSIAAAARRASPRARAPAARRGRVEAGGHQHKLREHHPAEELPETGQLGRVAGIVSRVGRWARALACSPSA